MTGTATTKTSLLERIDQGRASWETLLADIGEERMEQPFAAGSWTFKDVAAHVNAWREWSLARLAAASTGVTPSPPWPAGMHEENETGVEEINAWFYERDRDRPAVEVIAVSREQLRQMRAAVETISAETLVAPDRFDWLGGYPMSAVIDGSLEHLDEHEQWTREWLAAQPASRQEGTPRSTT